MSKKKVILTVLLSFMMLVFFQCEMQNEIDGIDSLDKNLKSLSLITSEPTEELAGNNLSYPVIWAEGVVKTLRGEAGVAPYLNGEWWYWWGMAGVDPDLVPLSCKPDPDDPSMCDDGIPGQATGIPPGDGWVKAYLQKDTANIWQAGTADGSASPVVVDYIDWGDNLESVDWYTKSQVRTEVVLFKSLDPYMLEYEMRHVSGWGIDEVHGLAVAQTDEVINGLGSQGTIYSDCARLTIQKLLVDRDNPDLANLIWVPNEGWTENEAYIGELINSPIFNLAVYEGGDGPGYYSAEINVKGRVIYGYTWNVRKLNDQTENGGEAAGCYRITFSFDNNGPVQLNTFFNEGITQILLPLEEVVTISSSESDDDGAGGTAIIDFSNNLTYIDINILQKSGGGQK